MDRWHVLAYSKNGVYKIKLRKMMIKPEAIQIGKEECERGNLTYVGVYRSDEIEKEENRLQLKLNA